MSNEKNEHGSPKESSIDEYIVKPALTILKERACISRCPAITNCLVGECAQVILSTIEETSILSTNKYTVQVCSASLSGCLLMPSSRVEGNQCRIEKVIMFSNSTVSGNAIVVSSVLGPDSSIGIINNI